MKLMYTENYEAMSEEAADLLLDTLRKRLDAIICLATGSSPVWMYGLVCEAANRERIDLSEIIFARLDEWYGVEPQAAYMCTTFIRRHLLDQLYMQLKAVVEFVPSTADIRQKLDGMDVFLSEHPVDVTIPGPGMNGHLGLNEPVDFLILDACYAGLDKKTETHSMVEGHELRGGLTIGLQGIFTSGQILIPVCGDRKEAAYQTPMSQRMAISVPASLLWLYPNCVTLVDNTVQK